MEDGDRKREEKESPAFLWGATAGIVFPPQPLPGPSQKPPGVPGFPRKNISAPITPEPKAGLFTLAWPPDSFTDVTYRHTGTLSQRGSRSRERRRRRRAHEEWRSKEDGGRVTRMEDGGEEKWHKLRRKGGKTEESERCEGARVFAYSDLNRRDQIRSGEIARGASCSEGQQSAR